MNDSVGNRIRPKLLFVCVENSCRSQMAEAFARIPRTDLLEVFSAGSQPSGDVHPHAIHLMAEIGYDLTVHRSQGLDEIPSTIFDVVVTMGCGDACPNIQTHHRLDWNIRDPKHLPLHESRKIRDDLGNRVVDLLDQIVLTGGS